VLWIAADLAREAEKWLRVSGLGREGAGMERYRALVATGACSPERFSAKVDHIGIGKR